METPIACSLTSTQLADRRRTVLDSIRKDMRSIARLPAGYAYDFPMTSEMLKRVNHLVELERQCCAFLTFTITESDTSIRLEITGPEAATPMIASLFGD